MIARKLVLAVLMIVAMGVFGCTLTTTIIMEDGYDVRLVNRSGEQVKMRWDEGSYRYLDNGSSIYIPADAGFYHLEWERASKRSRTRSMQIFRIEVDANIEIVFRDDPDDFIAIHH